MQRYERLSLMIEEIDRGRYPSVEHFCQMFECEKRTVHGDIAYLRDFMGYAIEWDRFHKGYVNKNPKKKLPLFELNEGELFMLTLGKDMLAEYGGTTFEPLLRTALTKIEQRLSDKVAVDLGELTSIVKFKSGHGTVTIPRKTFMDLNRACQNHKVVALTYVAAHSGQATIRYVEPYRLVESRGAWYLVAWCRLREAMRIFALHRISDYKVLDDTFEERDGEDVDEYLNAAFQLEHKEEEPQTCVINFDPQAARYVRERQFHPSQNIVNHEDGSCTMTFQATSLDEVKRWVLPYGAQAEVIDPPALRKLVVSEFERGMERYSKVRPIPTKRRAAAAQAANEPATELMPDTGESGNNQPLPD